MRRTLGALSGGLIVFALAACGGNGASGAPSTDASEAAAPSAAASEAAPPEAATVRMAFPNLRCIQNFPTYVAQAVGYFEDENLDVETEVISGSSAIAQQLLAGNLDVGLVSATTPIQAASVDQDLRVFYSVAYQSGFTLVVRADSAITDVSGLEGGVIGITEASGGEVPLVQAVMASAGLAEGTGYSLLPVGDGGPVTFDALQSGEVDAYSSSIFDVATLQSAGLELESVLPEEYRYVPSTSFAATGEMLTENSDVLARYGRAIAKATVFGQANPDAVRAMCQEFDPDFPWDDTDFVDAAWEATLGYYAPHPRMEDAPWGAHDLDAWQTYVDAAVEAGEDAGGLAEPIDIEAVADDSLIDQINDFDEAEVVAEAEAYSP